MRRKLGVALIVIGAVIFVIGFVVVEDYIGIFLMPVGLALLVGGLILRKREALPSPWPPPAPMPPTIDEEIQERKGLTPTPEGVAKAKARTLLNVIVAIFAAILIPLNLAAGSNLTFVLVPVVLLFASLSRLISGRIIARRRGK